jgi:hypothetical protein
LPDPIDLAYDTDDRLPAATTVQMVGVILARGLLGVFHSHP